VGAEVSVITADAGAHGAGRARVSVAARATECVRRVADYEGESVAGLLVRWSTPPALGRRLTAHALAVPTYPAWLALALLRGGEGVPCVIAAVGRGGWQYASFGEEESFAGVLRMHPHDRALCG